MIPKHFKHNQIPYLLTINGLGAWQKMCQLNEPIYNSEDGIKTFERWKISNEIQRYRFLLRIKINLSLVCNVEDDEMV